MALACLPQAAVGFEIAINVEKPGQVSTAVYNAGGRMVRELARAWPLPAGRQALLWDGLDMDCRPVPPGDYEWRSLQTQGLRSEYLMSVCTSVGDRWWPANLSGSVAFAKWDAAGKLVWKVSNKARRIGGQRRGELHAPVRVLGEVNGCIGVADRIAKPTEFWTSDGLYVGGLFDHRTDDGLPAAFYARHRADRGGKEAGQLENQSPVDYDMVTGDLLFQRANGDVIYCADGWNNLPTYRITGWDKFDRQQGALHLAAASKPAAVGTGVSARYAAAGTGAAAVREGVDPQIWFGDAALFPQ